MALRGVQGLLFDVFGTVVDWQGSVARELEARNRDMVGVDWVAFAKEWRQGYYEATRRVAEGRAGSTNIDQVHREILERMLASTQWGHVGRAWDEAKRQDSNLVWHSLNGWSDATEGLYALKKQAIIGTLSNGNVKLLVDMAKHTNLPWDVVFSGELLGSFKPNPKVYTGGIHHLALRPEQVAMVAAHIYDLRAAAAHGMKTVYVRRPTEDVVLQDQVKTKADGGEVDVVVDSFLELAEVLKASNSD